MGGIPIARCAARAASDPPERSLQSEAHRSRRPALLRFIVLHPASALLRRGRCRSGQEHPGAAPILVLDAYDNENTVPREVAAQAVWLGEGDDGFDNPAWEAVESGPVLGRNDAARWLEKRGQRRDAALMRLTGSTQLRRAPAIHTPQRRENAGRQGGRRTRRVRRASSSSRGDPDDDPAPGRAGLPRTSRNRG